MSENNQKKKVLIVEDSSIVRKKMVWSLKDLDIEIFEAFDGYDGLKQAHAHNPDLILADINMGRLDGITMIEILRKEGVSSDVLIVSASGYIEDQRRAKDCGAKGWITKPYETKILKYAVCKVLKIDNPRSKESDVVEPDKHGLSRKLFSPSLNAADTEEAPKESLISSYLSSFQKDEQMEVCQKFLNEFQKGFALFGSAIAKNDVMSIATLIKSIKPMAVNVGAIDLAVALDKLATSACNQNKGRCGQLFVEMAEANSVAVADINEHFNALKKVE